MVFLFIFLKYSDDIYKNIFNLNINIKVNIDLRIKCLFLDIVCFVI